MSVNPFIYTKYTQIRAGLNGHEIFIVVEPGGSNVNYLNITTYEACPGLFLIFQRATLIKNKICLYMNIQP
jgi:hypothetical protein